MQNYYAAGWSAPVTERGDVRPTGGVQRGVSGQQALNGGAGSRAEVQLRLTICYPCETPVVPVMGNPACFSLISDLIFIHIPHKLRPHQNHTMYRA